ncbi:citrate synthase [Gordonia hankookensis]|uniref:citrate synthase (unknown stereospecificity) n=1 Tax=Gordonia hankookensis TaxID=589403 RepID=A0ABR7WB80_9ACTN|nr:citrate synthase [Gordonia hankookensis]MBD1320046.1 helix-turn-helix domain-containing protein [Gordonia hankookensis]
MARTHTRRFPKPIHHDGRDYLTTEQVARLLGVKVATVYAYVSRGRMTSVRIDGVDGSVFAVEEVEGVLEGRPRRAPAGAVERIRTGLTLLQDDRLYYRGHDVVELADRGFEQAANLLWDNENPWPSAGVDTTTTAVIRTAGGPRARGLDLIRLTVDVLGARDPHRHRRDPATVTGTAARVIDACVDVLGDGTGHAGSIAERLWPCLTDDPSSPQKTAQLDAALVLLADHDMSAGTVAARVAASARGSIYAVLGAGLGAFDGPVHGGATTLAHRFLAAALDDPAGAVAEHLYMGNDIPGTGHVVYRHRDPRADLLLDLLAHTDGGDLRVVSAVEAIRRQLPESAFPNSDLALAALALRYRMRRDAAETIFALARMAGWTAHALEEYDERRLRFRPEGVYAGVRPESLRPTAPPPRTSAGTAGPSPSPSPGRRPAADP